MTIFFEYFPIGEAVGTAAMRGSAGTASSTEDERKFPYNQSFISADDQTFWVLEQDGAVAGVSKDLPAPGATGSSPSSSSSSGTSSKSPSRNTATWRRYRLATWEERAVDFFLAKKAAVMSSFPTTWISSLARTKRPSQTTETRTRPTLHHVRAIRLWDLGTDEKTVLQKLDQNFVTSFELRERSAHLGLFGLLFNLRHTVIAVQMSNGKEVLVDKNADTGVWCRHLGRGEELFLWKKYGFLDSVFFHNKIWISTSAEKKILVEQKLFTRCTPTGTTDSTVGNSSSSSQDVVTRAEPSTPGDGGGQTFEIVNGPNKEDQLHYMKHGESKNRSNSGTNTIHFQLPCAASSDISSPSTSCAPETKLENGKQHLAFTTFWQQFVTSVPSYSEPMDSSNCQNFCSELLQKLAEERVINCELTPVGGSCTVEFDERRSKTRMTDEDQDKGSTPTVGDDPDRHLHPGASTSIREVASSSSSLKWGLPLTDVQVLETERISILDGASARIKSGADDVAGSLEQGKVVDHQLIVNGKPARGASPHVTVSEEEDQDASTTGGVAGETVCSFWTINPNTAVVDADELLKLDQDNGHFPLAPKSNPLMNTLLFCLDGFQLSFQTLGKQMRDVIEDNYHTTPLLEDKVFFDTELRGSSTFTASLQQHLLSPAVAMFVTMLNAAAKATNPTYEYNGRESEFCLYRLRFLTTLGRFPALTGPSKRQNNMRTSANHHPAARSTAGAAGEAEMRHNHRLAPAKIHYGYVYELTPILTAAFQAKSGTNVNQDSCRSTSRFPIRNEGFGLFLRKHHYVDSEFKAEPDPYSYVTKSLLSWWCKTKVIQDIVAPTWMKNFALVLDERSYEKETEKLSCVQNNNTMLHSIHQS
ncbi:unnamed protein product [Amoebophrya sp. A120]|nr:unnamed protein product [Amoebophrya sp. A120]|eukprot:GSA120T00009319001.1